MIEVVYRTCREISSYEGVEVLLLAIHDEAAI